MSDGRVVITGPKEVTLPSALGGDDQVYGLVLVCVTRGLFVEVVDADTVKLVGIKDFALLTKQVVALLVSKGCEVSNYPIWLEVAPDAEVPEGVPGRTYQDDEEQTQVHTWSTWNSHEIQERDGSYYLAAVLDEHYLPASVWVPLMMAGTITVLNKPEFDALAASEE